MVTVEYQVVTAEDHLFPYERYAIFTLITKLHSIRFEHIGSLFWSKFFY